MRVVFAQCRQVTYIRRDPGNPKWPSGIDPVAGAGCVLVAKLLQIAPLPQVPVGHQFFRRQNRSGSHSMLL